MLSTYIISILVILAALVFWIVVQAVARAFARRHPEFGPAREEGEGCGGLCFCKTGDSCPKRKLKELITNHPPDQSGSSNRSE